MIKLSVNATPAVVDTNFEMVSKALDKHLEKYDTVLTADTVKEGKAAATEVNKLKSEIHERVREVAKELGAPIDDLKAKGKTLTDKCETVRQRLLVQADVFEAETRKKAENMLTMRRAEQWAAQGVREDFMSAEFDDLILISSVTGKGQLTKKARDTLDARVAADRAAQDRHDGRLARLEAESYRAGLKSPLTAVHVSSILSADDAAYDEGLRRIIATEVERQEAIESQIKERAEREAREKAEAEQQEKLDAERQRIREEERAEAERRHKTEVADGMVNAVAGKAPALVQGTDAEAHPAAPSRAEHRQAHADRYQAAPGPHYGAGISTEARSIPPAFASGEKTSYRVTAVFHVSAPAHFAPEAIEAGLRSRMQKAGFTTLTAVHVIPQSQA